MQPSAPSYLPGSLSEGHHQSSPGNASKAHADMAAGCRWLTAVLPQQGGVSGFKVYLLQSYRSHPQPAASSGVTCALDVKKVTVLHLCE